MLGQMNHKLESKLVGGRNINNLRHGDDATLMAESKEELKSLQVKLKKENEKIVLKLNIKKLRSWYLFPSLHGKYKGGKWKPRQILFSWAQKNHSRQ